MLPATSLVHAIGCDHPDVHRNSRISGGTLCVAWIRWVQEGSLLPDLRGLSVLAVAFIISGLVMSMPRSNVDLRPGGWIRCLDPGRFCHCTMASASPPTLILTFTYWRQLGSVTGTSIALAPIGPLVLFNSPPLELIIILLLGFIVSAQILPEKGKSWRRQSVVTVSFILVLISHILILLESGSNDYSLYLLARGLQMFGFALIVVFLYRLGRLA